MQSVIFVAALATLATALTAELVVAQIAKTGELQYCSFFNNRAPNVQMSLKNCTWFKKNSCCRQEEIDATFGRVKPLRGASPACQRYTNYLMCYICAPNQHLFYARERLTVCVEFCDAWYAACQSAIMKGSVIHDLFSTGREFCESRRFQVDRVANGQCYYFDAKRDTSGAGGLRGPLLPLLPSWLGGSPAHPSSRPLSSPLNRWWANACAVFVIWALGRLLP